MDKRRADAGLGYGEFLQKDAKDAKGGTGS